MKRLRDIETPLAIFFASGILALGEKLGPSSGKRLRRWTPTPNGSRIFSGFRARWAKLESWRALTISGEVDSTSSPSANTHLRHAMKSAEKAMAYAPCGAFGFRICSVDLRAVRPNT